jgi:hypothetical protein
MVDPTLKLEKGDGPNLDFDLLMFEHVRTQSLKIRE